MCGRSYATWTAGPFMTAIKTNLDSKSVLKNCLDSLTIILDNQNYPKIVLIPWPWEGQKPDLFTSLFKPAWGQRSWCYHDKRKVKTCNPYFTIWAHVHNCLTFWPWQISSGSHCWYTGPTTPSILAFFPAFSFPFVFMVDYSISISGILFSWRADSIYNYNATWCMMLFFFRGKLIFKSPFWISAEPSPPSW